MNRLSIKAHLWIAFAVIPIIPVVFLSTLQFENIQQFGLPAVVAINAFPTDTAEELRFVEEKCNTMGAEVALSEVWAKGSL